MARTPPPSPPTPLLRQRRARKEGGENGDRSGDEPSARGGSPSPGLFHVVQSQDFSRSFRLKSSNHKTKQPSSPWGFFFLFYFCFLK